MTVGPDTPSGGREQVLSDKSAVPIIVIAERPDHVEAINSTLRNAGHPVHCTHIPDVGDLADALNQINPELLLVFSEEINTSLEQLDDIRNSYASGVPILDVREEVDEDSIATSMRLGAQDVVSLRHRDRLQWVCGRELRAFRLERALNRTLASATEYKRALHAFMEGSADAIAHVQEGIIVDTNPAWLELFGYPETDAIDGMPLMDFFDVDNHAALKGALVACGQGKWGGHDLKIQGLCSDGSALALHLQLEEAEFDGDDCVRVSIKAGAEENREPEARITDVATRDPLTGLLHRQQFLAELERAVAEPIKGGVRALAYVTPDKFRSIKRKVGPLASEDVIAKLASMLEELAGPDDLVGRFGGTMFAILLARGTERDIEEWADSLCARVRRLAFEGGGKSISVSCTIGVAPVGGGSEDIAELVATADAANERGREEGGDRVVVHKVDLESSSRTEVQDAICVKLIKAALMENRLHLVHQPIASLQSQDKDMYDVVVRMKDPRGNEILPGDFLPAAERNGLMKTLDRWIINAAVQFCAARRASRVFVRISSDSISDKGLPKWIAQLVKSAKLPPSVICIQIPESVASEHLLPSQELSQQLGELGFAFAIEHFGLETNAERLLDHMAVDYVKIDGSLMQGLASNEIKQSQVRALVEMVRPHQVQTIAERVEDANTMAALWQLGVQSVQGYYVQEPEVVLEDAAL
jgi:diguanylate cyclase (GGDEF)-like protein/PAS domain S-box-containing protein